MSTPTEFQRVKAELAALRESIAADIEAYPNQTMVSCGCYANAARIARDGADA